MSTKIVDPTTRTSAGGAQMGAASGAMQGAAAGTAVLPGIGTVVGAVVGGVLGGIGGKNKAKAQMHGEQAYKYAKLRQERQAAVARRDIVRQFRMARANSMTLIGNESGGTRSSAPQGAVSSLGAQFGFNLAFFDADSYLNYKTQEHANKAGKYAAKANEINALLSTATSAVSSMAPYFKPASPPPPATTTPPPSTSSPYGPYQGGYQFPTSTSGMGTPFNPYATTPFYLRRY